MKKRPTYRDLQRRVKEYDKRLVALEETIQDITNSLIEELAHAKLGQDILENVVKQAAYKELTFFEAKNWIEQKWNKRHEYQGSLVERIEWLGLPGDIEAQLQDVYSEYQEEYQNTLLRILLSKTKGTEHGKNAN